MSERLTGALVQAAPLLGLPVWLWVILTHDLWDDLDHGPIALLIFVPGLFMLGAGLFVALVARFAPGSAFVREQAVASLRFHRIVAAIGVVLAVVLIAVMILDPSPHTLDRQPVRLEAALSAFVFAFGAILTIIEAVRSVVAGAIALRPARR